MSLLKPAVADDVDPDIAAGGGPVAYRFPASARDLRTAEYWVLQPAPGGAGFSLDCRVCAFDEGTWQATLKPAGATAPGGTAQRTSGKPVLAMADGEVVDFGDPAAGQQQPGDVFFSLRHGRELLRYGPLQAGSLNAILLVKGARVQAGQYLGLAAGGAGASLRIEGCPESHRESRLQPAARQPLVLRDCWLLPLDEHQPASPDNEWVHAGPQGLALPELPGRARLAVWPYPTRPTWFPPGHDELCFPVVPQVGYRELSDRLTRSGYRLHGINGFETGGQACLTLIYRARFPGDESPPTRAFHGLDGGDYQAMHDEWVEGRGYRLGALGSYQADGAVRHAGLFLKRPGPAQVAFHGCSDADLSGTCAALQQQGYAAVNLSAAVEQGRRIWCGYFERGLPGGTVLETALTEDQFVAGCRAQRIAGRGLAFASAYSLGGSPRIVAIWHAQAPQPKLALHGMSTAFYLEQQAVQAEAGRLTQALVGYENHGAPAFLAWWHE